MVVITDEYLTDLFSTNTTEAQSSHLTLPNKKITKVALLKDHCRFRLLDLRDNMIGSTVSFKNQFFLTYLFLQNNSIKKLEGFGNLKSLETLFLDGNKIEVIENIEKCPLKKLSVSGQRLGKGQALAFDPNTMNALGFNLEVLYTSKNNLCSLKPIRYLFNLKTLDASENNMTEVSQLGEGLCSMMCLKSLNVLGNPLVRKKSSVKKIVAFLPNLEKLNNIEVTPQMHQACEHMQRASMEQQMMDSYGELKNMLKNRFGEVPTSVRPKVSKGLVNSVTDKVTRQRYIDDNIEVK